MQAVRFGMHLFAVKCFILIKKEKYAAVRSTLTEKIQQNRRSRSLYAFLRAKISVRLSRARQYYIIIINKMENFTENKSGKVIN